MLLLAAMSESPYNSSLQQNAAPTKRNHNLTNKTQGETTSARLDNKINIWSGFHKKTILERQDQLRLVFPNVNPAQELPISVADNMIENCIGKYELPLGLGLNFVINGQPFVVPMALEEPSVIAAVSGAAKLIAQHGGFKACSTGNIMIAQIQLLDVPEPEAAAKKILEDKIELTAYANTFCPSMVRRGGGVIDIRPRVVRYNAAKYLDVVDKAECDLIHSTIDRSEVVTAFDNSLVTLDDSSSTQYQGTKSQIQDTQKPNPMIIIHVYIDVCESMGANLCSTVAEGLAPKIIELIGGGRVVLRIVSNLADERRAKATFLIPVRALAYKGLDGMSVAKGIIEAYAMACEDHYRCSTHNKGIMNGIDAAAIAMGQDWRAIEAAAHAWACRTGRYQPLTHYKLARDKESQEIYLFGMCEMPIAVGVRGGAIQTHPIMSFTHGLMDNPTCQQLAQILVCVGLAQNFAAMRALVSEGIQRGHMALHSRNIAIGAGVPPHLVSEVSNYMISIGRIDHETAADYLRSHQIAVSSSNYKWKAISATPPSTLFVEFEALGMKFTLNIVFQTIGSEPFQFIIAENDSVDTTSPLQKELFGEKTASWFKQTLTVVDNIRVIPKATQKLMKLYPTETQEFIGAVVSADEVTLSTIVHPDSPSVIRAGFSLVMSLLNVFYHHVEANVSSNLLVNALREEQHLILSSLHRSSNLYKTARSLERFMLTHSKHWQVTIFLLCDMQALQSTAITTQRLYYTFNVGRYLEWEGTIAHDLARWERDYREGTPNVYTFWLQLNNYQPSSDTLKQFTEEMDKILQEKKQKLLDKNAIEFFDVRLFLNAVPVVRQHYGLPKRSLVSKRNLKAKL